jgi:AraC family transcriptional regulator
MTGRHLDTATDPASMPHKKLRAGAASGRVYFWQTGSLWIGSGRGRSDWHNHHAHQLVLALEGEFRFRADRRGPWAEYQAAIVPSHCPHEFELDGAVAHLFVEPESTEGRALSRHFAALGISTLPAEAARRSAGMLLGAFRGNADSDAMKTIARSAVATLAGKNDVTTMLHEGDARVARALDYIRSQVRTAVSLADAAGVATLSPSRFRHLFVKETGTSFRAYLLWLRINVAIEAAMAGASWTEAAHEAGFADSSHLTRTHKRMFGIEPTAVRHE